MVAILIRRVCNNIIEMKRHKQPNVRQRASSVPHPDAIRRSPLPQRPPGAEDSRDAHSASAAAAASANAVVDDFHYNATPSFEHRDEQRSAFSSVQSVSADEIATKSAAEKHAQEQEQSPSCTWHMPRRTGARNSEDVRQDARAEPLPFHSPLRFYHQDQHPHHHHATSEHQQADADTPAPYYPHHHHYPDYHPSYSHHDQYDYSSYYPPPTNSESHTSRMAQPNSQYHHPPYPSRHHHQDYSTHYPQEYPYGSYYPTATASRGPHPASPCSARYPPPHQYQRYQGATPPTSHLAIPDATLKETSSAVTVSTKTSATPPSSMAPMEDSGIRGGGGGGGEGVNPSSLPTMEDDRKPAAGRQSPLGRVPEKGSPPQQGQDFEPIPFNEIGAIPVLAAGDLHPHSPSAYGTASTTETPFHPAFDGASFHHRTSTPPGLYSRTAPVAPPNPQSTPVTQRRQQQRTLLAPSSSGSTASSKGGEGGSWERRFVELLEFKRLHHHCEVPQSYAENTSLGTWVNKQRMEQKNRTEGKNSSLNDSRMERLQSVGFRWAKRKGQASWDEKFDALVAYKAKHGNCHVPTKYKDNTALGRWISTQRAEYKKYQEGSKCSMNADKIRKLENIGFAWFMAL